VLLEYRLVVVRLLDGKQSGAYREYVQVFCAHDPVAADAAFGLAPEPSLFVRGNAPASLDGERKARSLTAADMRDQLGEERDSCKRPVEALFPPAV
jgi:hypothetical protein